jgi:hypothetical protein
MVNQTVDDEINVEGTVYAMAATFDFADPEGCRDILRRLTDAVEAGLKSREERLQRDGD